MITTDAQDRTLGELFAQEDVLTLEVNPVTDTLVVAMDDNGRQWLIDHDGEIVTETDEDGLWNPVNPAVVTGEAEHLLEEARDVEDGRRERQDFYLNRDYRETGGIR